MKFNLSENRTIEVNENCIQLELDFVINLVSKFTIISYGDIVDIKLKKFKWLWWICGELIVVFFLFHWFRFFRICQSTN